MSVQVRARREAGSFLASFVGAQGELLVDTTSNRVQVHDGVTPGGAPAAKLSEVVTNTRTGVADAAYIALTTDRTIAVTSLTAARTITLPAAAAYPTGTQLLVFDESGACSASATITIARAGTDTINGATSTAITTAYGYLAFESNGASRWTVVDQTAVTSSSGGGTARTQVADANYVALTSDRLIGFTSLTAARTVTLPSAAGYPTGTRLLLVDESGVASAANTITLLRTGSETINGAGSASISTPYGYVELESNGSSKWTITDQPGGASSSGIAPTVVQGRLTLASGAPVMTSAVPAATGIVYTPYIGNQISLWNGTQFVPAPFSEVSQALSDTTKSPSAAAASSVYDLFAWSDAGTFRVTRGPAWSAGATAGSNIARGAGAASTALVRQNGILVNQFAITNGPAAGYGTYVGTIATDAGGATVSFQPGAASAGGTAAVVGLWNAYNRVNAGGSVRDTTASWTYATAAWRPPNGSANMRVTFVVGLAEDVWVGRYSAIQTSSASGYSACGVGIDTTTTFTGTTGYAVASSTIPMASEGSIANLIGQHFLSALEYASAGTITAYGAGGAAVAVQSGFNWSGRY